MGKRVLRCHSHCLLGFSLSLSLSLSPLQWADGCLFLFAVARMASVLILFRFNRVITRMSAWTGWSFSRNSEREWEREREREREHLERPEPWLVIVGATTNQEPSSASACYRVLPSFLKPSVRIAQYGHALCRRWAPFFLLSFRLFLAHVNEMESEMELFDLIKAGDIQSISVNKEHPSQWNLDKNPVKLGKPLVQ